MQCLKFYQSVDIKFIDYFHWVIISHLLCITSCNIVSYYLHHANLSYILNCINTISAFSLITLRPWITFQDSPYQIITYILYPTKPYISSTLKKNSEENHHSEDTQKEHKRTQNLQNVTHDVYIHSQNNILMFLVKMGLKPWMTPPPQKKNISNMKPPYT